MKFNQCNHFCPSCGGKKSPGAQHCRKCANSLFPPRKGAKLSKEVKQKIAHKLLGNIPWNKDKKGNQQAWNKGLTKETDIRIAAYSKNLMGIKKIVKKKMSDRQRQIIRERMFGDKNPSKRIEVRDKISKSLRRAFKNNPGILENRKRCGHNQYTDTYSNIEKIMADELVSRGIEFSHNFRVGRYFADFVVFGNTIIE